MNFKVITGYPDYLISGSGEIFSLKRTLGYKNTDIGACCNGKMKRAYGFIWRYIGLSYGREGFI